MPFIFGPETRDSMNKIDLKEITHDNYNQDLTNATAAVGAAGNQLIGDALYLGERFFAIPKKDHHEQMMNSHYPQKTRAGIFSTLETITIAKPREFPSKRGRCVINQKGNSH